MTQQRAWLDNLLVVYSCFAFYLAAQFPKKFGDLGDGGKIARICFYPSVLFALTSIISLLKS